MQQTFNEQQNPIMPEEESEGFNLEEFGYTLLAHWQWIAASVVIALGIAFTMLLRTTPTYTRSCSLLIKDEEKGGGRIKSGLASEFQAMGILQSSININNEILTLTAPVLMQEAVKRLHLEVQMSVKRGLHTEPLYDQAPVNLLVPNAPENDACAFKMRLKQDKTAELWDFRTGNEEDLAKRVVVKMNTLAKTPVGTVVVQPTKYWNTDFTAEEITVCKYPLKHTAAAYNGALGVVLADKESTILNLSMKDASKQRADDLLLKVIEVYNEQWLKDRNRVAESSFEFITARLNDLTKELGDVDQQISDYKSAALLPDVDAASNMYLSQSVKNSDQILTLNNQLSVARYIRQYMDDASKQGQYLPSNTGIGSTGIEQMIDAYNKLVSSRNEVLDNSSEQAPLVQKFNNDIALQRQAIIRSLDNFITQLSSQIKSWEKNESSTNAKLASAPRQVKQLLSVGRQQKVKEALYIYLLQKREENELSKTFIAWNTNLIQPPMGSDFPSAPRRSMTLLIALVIGFCIPAGVLFVRDSMDHSVRGRADLDHLQVPFLGEIPNMLRRKHWWNIIRKKNVKRGIYVEENKRDIINESFRLLRTNLDYFMRGLEGDKKVVMLTSFNAGSGKSFLSANLSKVLQLKGKRVLSVDLDMRHTSFTSMVVKHVGQGISGYLNKMTDNVDDIILRDALGQGADFIPVGPLPPNPTEILLNGRLSKLIEEVRDKYDYIILDCPPIDIVADTNIIKDFAEITLFVVRAGLMDRRSLKEVDRLYTSKNYHNMAIVLNGTNYVTSRYGNYRYGYSYGYNYGYGKYSY